MSKLFRVAASNVKWHYEKTSNPGLQDRLKKVGRLSIDIKCDCGNAWTASGGRQAGPMGHFMEIRGGVKVTCPDCGRYDQFSDAETK